MRFKTFIMLYNRTLIHALCFLIKIVLALLYFSGYVEAFHYTSFEAKLL